MARGLEPGLVNNSQLETKNSISRAGKCNFDAPRTPPFQIGRRLTAQWLVSARSQIFCRSVFKMNTTLASLQRVGLTDWRSNRLRNVGSKFNIECDCAIAFQPVEKGSVPGRGYCAQKSPRGNIHEYVFDPQNYNRCSRSVNENASPEPCDDLRILIRLLRGLWVYCKAENEFCGPAGLFYTISDTDDKKTPIAHFTFKRYLRSGYEPSPPDPFYVGCYVLKVYTAKQISESTSFLEDNNRPHYTLLIPSQYSHWENVRLTYETKPEDVMSLRIAERLIHSRRGLLLTVRDVWFTSPYQVLCQGRVFALQSHPRTRELVPRSDIYGRSQGRGRRSRSRSRPHL